MQGQLPPKRAADPCQPFHCHAHSPVTTNLAPLHQTLPNFQTQPVPAATRPTSQNTTTLSTLAASWAACWLHAIETAVLRSQCSVVANRLAVGSYLGRQSTSTRPPALPSAICLGGWLHVDTFAHNKSGIAYQDKSQRPAYWPQLNIDSLTQTGVSMA
jgi:hypothetical protein